MTRNRPNRGWRLAVLALAGLLGTGALALAGPPDDDPFAKVNAAVAAAPAAGPKEDPFAPANKAPSATPPTVGETKAAVAEGKPADERKPATADLISFKVELVPATARRGETVQLTITGKPQTGYHTYPITQRADNPDQPVDSSKIVFADAAGLQPLYPIRENKPELENLGTGPVLVYNHEFSWVQDLFVPADLQPGAKVLRFHIHVQVCDERGCNAGDHHFEVPFTVAAAPAAAAAPPGADRLKQPEIQVVPVGPTRGGAPPAPRAEEPVAASMPETFAEHKANLDAVLAQLQKQTAPENTGLGGLLLFALQGVGWGIVSLLTPCVFPMIPITVSVFLKQSERKDHRPLFQALVYSGTIILVLTIAAVALLSFFRWLSVNPIMNFALGALFVYFALSLFGMYEIELPSFLTNYTAAREGQGGVAGTVFMALTFTLVSFACVAPFLGGFGGTAAGSGITFWHRLLGGLAFATTFAAPFFFLALFPGLLRRLPKSGSWLNSVKVVMGFLEIAAALKFLRAGELIVLDRPALFTYDLVLGVYVVLAVLCGLYLLGVFRLPHDSPTESISVPRFVFALAFLSMGVYLAPALFKAGSEGQNQRPAGTLYAWVDSFLLPEPSEAKGELAWSGNLKAAVDQARASAAGRQLVFIDFTGKTCTNCALNEREVFPKTEVKDLLKRYHLVKLYTDEVPAAYYSAAVRSRFGSSTSRQQQDAKDANLVFQREAFGTEQLPLYVILEPRPQGDIEVAGVYSEGKINDTAGFVAFLQKPLEGAAH
jgi:thiol:disulfide interchange protein